MSVPSNSYALEFVAKCQVDGELKLSALHMPQELRFKNAASMPVIRIYEAKVYEDDLKVAAPVASLSALEEVLGKAPVSLSPRLKKDVSLSSQTLLVRSLNSGPHNDLRTAR